MRVVKHWHGLSREVGDALTLGTFKARLDRAGSSLGWWKGSLPGQGGETGGSVRSLPTQTSLWFHDSTDEPAQAALRPATPGQQPDRRGVWRLPWQPLGLPSLPGDPSLHEGWASAPPRQGGLGRQSLRRAAQRQDRGPKTQREPGPAHVAGGRKLPAAFSEFWVGSQVILVLFCEIT